ncbi:hypothetical protein ACFL6X_05955 [Candidatus Latescibacterota bacterium]
MRVLLPGATIGAALLLSSALFAAEDIVIDTRAAWEEWVFPLGTLEMVDPGTVRVAQQLKDINPVLDATHFAYESHTGPATGGIRSAGSNAADAARIIDGDPTTSWAPDASDGLADWWVEVDLGRALPVTEIRLVFDEAGPPFSEFRIFVSDGELRFPGTKLKSLRYDPLSQTVSPNEDYVYTVPVTATDQLGNPLIGQLYQFIKVFVDRPVDGAALAEVEVSALGQNIARGTVERGGQARSGQVSLPVSIFDGLMWTGWKMTNLGSNWLQGANLLNGPWVRWDLGAEFWMDVIRIHSSSGGTAGGDAQPNMDGFRLYVSDGRESAIERHDVWKVDGRNVEWDLIADIDNTPNYPTPLSDFEFHYDPPLKARHVFFHHFYGASVWRMGYSLGAMMFECQIFGEGRVPGVDLESPLFETGGGYISTIEWDGEIPADTRVELQTRTGDEVEEVVQHYDKNGQEITEAKYNSIPSSFRGEIVRLRLPVEAEWSTWSPVYKTSGDPFVSPSPSRYVMIRAKLASDSPEVSPALDRITLRVVDPVLARVVATVEPREDVYPGEPTDFTYRLEGTYRAGNSGYDRVRIRVPHEAADIEVYVSDIRTAPDSVSYAGGFLGIHLPRRVTLQPVEIRFRTFLGRDNTVFEGQVARGSGGWQGVEPGEGDGLTVRLPGFAEGSGLIHDLDLGPGVVTPNGDGINDVASVRFTVYKVDAPRPIEVRIHDLAGRLVKEVYAELGASGVYGAVGEISWDGRDAGGHPVPPGAYVCRVHVRGDAISDTEVRAIAVVY